MILKMPHQQVGEVNLVDEMVDRLLDILADTACRRTALKLLFTAVWTATLRRSFTKNWVPAYRRPARK